MTQHFRKAGFTLIELSIVLVIIGLIVGGILVGRDMIDAATLRSVMSQQEQIQTAVNTFQAKYNCLPGDCTNADAFGFSVSTPFVHPNGNGDGMLSAPNGYMFPDSGNPPGNEMIMFWAELSEAGLIANYQAPASAGWDPSGSWPPGDQPYGFGFASKIRQCSWWVGSSAYSASGSTWTHPVDITPLGNVLALVGPVTRCSTFTCGGARYSECLLPGEAESIDAKLDDGMPWTGHIHAASGWGYIDDGALSSPGGWINPPDDCVFNNADPTSPYASPATNYHERCNLLFKLN